MTCPSTYTPNKLHTELLERSSGSAGSGLKATLPGRGGRQEPGRDTLALWSSLQGTPSPTPRWNRKQPSVCSHCHCRQPCQRRGSRYTGMASCCCHGCNGPRLPPLTARPAGGLPTLGTHSLPLCRVLCHLPGHHGPECATWCWRPRAPRVRQGGESARPGSTHFSG